MSRVGKVVAVVAVAGSLAWVGHQVVRHHEKAHRLHAEVAEFMIGVHQSHHASDQGVVSKQGDSHQDWRQSGDEDQWGRPWRRHHEYHEHGEQLTPQEAAEAKTQLVSDVEETVTPVNAKIAAPSVVVGGDYGGAMLVQEGNKLTGHFVNSNRPAFVGELTAPDSGYVNFPDDRTYHFEYDANSRIMYWDGRNSGNVWLQLQQQQVPDQAQKVELPQHPQVPELEDNNEQEQENEQEESNEEARHQSRRFGEEKHYREFESSLTDEERAELRKLRKEARRLHRDAARTVGGFVAGAAFVGGVAHLRRLRRHTAGAGACHNACTAKASEPAPSVTNA